MRSLTDLSFEPGGSSLTARLNRPVPPAELHADVLTCDSKGRLSAARVLTQLGIEPGQHLTAHLEPDALVLRPAKKPGPTTVTVDGRLRLNLPVAWRRWLQTGTSTPTLVIVGDASNQTLTIRSVATLLTAVRR
jgi:hypothetical protein